MGGLVKGLVTGQSLVLDTAVPMEDVVPTMDAEGVTLTGAAAAGSAPTKAEYDKTVVDVAAINTELGAALVDITALADAYNALIAELRTNGMIAPEAED
mgnify:CR=1 FL=1